MTAPLSFLPNTQPPADATAVLGIFDGMHRGHLALFAAARADARARGVPLLVFTFARTAALKSGAPQLCREEERLALFRREGAEHIVLADFAALRDLSPAEFVEEILLKRLRIRRAYAGYNFRFGRGAVGDADALAAGMAKGGGEAVILAPVLQDGKPISSSAVREALARGDCERAALLLGRPFSLTAPIAHGDGVGRTLGFPTANQRPDPALAPLRPGVYRVRCRFENGESCDGVCNYGIRPTVGGSEVRAETYLPGFSGDLYGRTVKTAFLAFLREEKKFPTLAALTAQIQKDTEEVLQWKTKAGKN